MARLPRKSLLVLPLLALLGCRQESAPVAPGGSDTSAAKQIEKVRQPAVAGIFYPAKADQLQRDVDRLLAAARVEPIENLRALVCPHAGYEYSAPVAANGYRQLVGRNVSTVILLGPSHWASFQGVFVSPADAYQTPLGVVPLSSKAATLAATAPFTAKPDCTVNRPDWWRQSSAAAPPEGRDTPETWEYSLEVQLPFLQRSLRDFRIVPVIFRQFVDPHKAANGIIPLLDAQTIIVVSTDLSHFHPYDEARTLDTHSVQAICNLDPAELTDESACGYMPVLTLIDIARQKGWKARVLDYRNSGDTAGKKSEVVGYAAIAFFEPQAGDADDSRQFTPSEGRLLLELARSSVAAAVAGKEPPKPDAAVSSKFQARRACFVTLTKNGQLRGCIGNIFPQEPLYQAVVSRARAAAVGDPRFPRVSAAELKEIEVEVSILTVPKPLLFSSPEDLLDKLRPGVDGVVLRVASQESTYLPQVWQQIPDRRQFMNELAEKAGLAPDAWTNPTASVLTYQAEAFKEEPAKAKATGK
jgi:MEMO1 family protein